MLQLRFDSKVALVAKAGAGPGRGYATPLAPRAIRVSGGPLLRHAFSALVQVQTRPITE